MRIKQEGKIPKWELDVKCEFCNTIITLEGPEDMYAREHGYNDSRNMDCHYTYHCKCPICGKEIKVPSHKIRHDIKERIGEKN